MRLHPNVFAQFSFLLMKRTMGGPQCEALTRCIKEALPVPAAIDFIAYGTINFAVCGLRFTFMLVNSLDDLFQGI